MRSGATTSTRVARWALAGCVVLVGSLTLGPLPTGLLRDVTDGIAAAAGTPARPLDQTVEKIGNIVMFVPATALTTLAFPRAALWLVFAGAVVASGAVESAQLVVAGRHPTVLDVALNAAGAALGVAAAHPLRRRGRSRLASARQPG